MKSSRVQMVLILAFALATLPARMEAAHLNRKLPHRKDRPSTFWSASRSSLMCRHRLREYSRAIQP